MIATNGGDGYVHADELAAVDGSDQTFTSPDDAFQWRRKREGKTFSVDVYLSDGKTRIGESAIG